MKAELVAYFLADAGLSALVGQRIEWEVLPQAGAQPSISLRVVSAPRDYTMRGRDHLTGYLVQMDVWADAFASREAVAAALISAIDNLRNATFQFAEIVNQRDESPSTAAPTAAGVSNLFRSSIDVRVWAQD